jgi:CheY-like chemotaxis protein
MGLILIVDDHADTRDVLQMFLKQWGHEAITADTGEAAFGLLVNQKPDLIIVDGMMPGMNGIEFIRLLRANEATALIAAVLYTAVADPDFTDNAIAKGAAEIWVKGKMQMDQIRERASFYAPVQPKPPQG